MSKTKTRLYPVLGPEQKTFPQYFELWVLDNLRELQKLDPAEGRNNTEALCLFNKPFTQGNRLGVMAFVRGQLYPGVVAHECVHAAMFFVALHVMPDCKLRGKQESYEHYSECCAHATESLVSQIFSGGFSALV